jgi:anti-sigma B factor antagonist
MAETAGDEPQLDVHVDREGESVLIGLVGELTLVGQEAFEAALQQLESEPVSNVVIDLAGVSFADTTGLLLLVTAWKRCRARGIGIAFEGASEQMQRLLEGTGLVGLLPIIPSGVSTDKSHRAPQPGAEWADGGRPPIPAPTGGPPHLAPDFRKP